MEQNGDMDGGKNTPEEAQEPVIDAAEYAGHGRRAGGADGAERWLSGCENGCWMMSAGWESLGILAGGVISRAMFGDHGVMWAATE